MKTKGRNYFFFGNVNVTHSFYKRRGFPQTIHTYIYFCFAIIILTSSKSCSHLGYARCRARWWSPLRPWSGCSTWRWWWRWGRWRGWRRPGWGGPGEGQVDQAVPWLASVTIRGVRWLNKCHVFLRLCCYRIWQNASFVLHQALWKAARKITCLVINGAGKMQSYRGKFHLKFECEFLVESPILGGPPPRKAKRGQLARLWTYSPPKHPPPPTMIRKNHHDAKKTKRQGNKDKYTERQTLHH